MFNIFRAVFKRVAPRVFSSFFKAYQDTVKSRGGRGEEAKSNPFAEQFQKVFVNSKMNTPMTAEEARLILQYEEKEIDPEKVMARYFTLIDKNKEAGSLYIQVKVMSAKDKLTEGFEDVVQELEKRRSEEAEKEKQNLPEGEAKPSSDSKPQK